MFSHGVWLDARLGAWYARWQKFPSRGRNSEFALEIFKTWVILGCQLHSLRDFIVLPGPDLRKSVRHGQ